MKTKVEPANEERRAHSSDLFKVSLYPLRAVKRVPKLSATRKSHEKLSQKTQNHRKKTFATETPGKPRATTTTTTGIATKCVTTNKAKFPKGDIRKAGERRRKTAEARGGYVADRQAATIMSCKHNFIQKD